jgi:hypothetical protein
MDASPSKRRAGASAKSEDVLAKFRVQLTEDEYRMLRQARELAHSLPTQQAAPPHLAAGLVEGAKDEALGGSA